MGVKFPDLIALARDLGAARLATGHYVRRVDGPDGPELHRAADPARDQSWFLFGTTRQQLAATLFPLGEMPCKDAVRAEAARLGLPVAEKADSQDICFVPSGSYADLVSRLRPDAAESGDIVSGDGRVLGRHDGIARFTVGQGKRLGAAASDHGQKQVVVALDAGRRRVVVGPPTTGSRLVAVRDVNWLVPAPCDALRCEVKLRAREQPHPAAVHVGAGRLEVHLDSPALAAPGQACVFYDGTRVLGGGFVDRQPEAAVAVDASRLAGLSPRPLPTGGGVAQR
jgi:tRNA-specific 2-thiouridylase